MRQVGAQRFTRATHLIFNPMAWGWLLSTLDTTGRPLFAVGGSEGAFNTMGASDNAGYSDFAGAMLGCWVLLSGNVPTNLGGGTNETRIIAADLRDSFLWEDGNSPPSTAMRHARAVSGAVDSTTVFDDRFGQVRPKAPNVCVSQLRARSPSRVTRSVSPSVGVTLTDVDVDSVPDEEPLSEPHMEAVLNTRHRAISSTNNLGLRTVTSPQRRRSTEVGKRLPPGSRHRTTNRVGQTGRLRCGRGYAADHLVEHRG